MPNDFFSGFRRHPDTGARVDLAALDLTEVNDASGYWVSLVLGGHLLAGPVLRTPSVAHEAAAAVVRANFEAARVAAGFDADPLVAPRMPHAEKQRFQAVANQTTYVLNHPIRLRFADATTVWVGPNRAIMVPDPASATQFRFSVDRTSVVLGAAPAAGVVVEITYWW